MSKSASNENFNARLAVLYEQYFNRLWFFELLTLVFYVLTQKFTKKIFFLHTYFVSTISLKDILCFLHFISFHFFFINIIDVYIDKKRSFLLIIPVIYFILSHYFCDIFLLFFLFHFLSLNEHATRTLYLKLFCSFLFMWNPVVCLVLISGLFLDILIWFEIKKINILKIFEFQI